MNALKPDSLGDQLSKKISAWIAILVTLIIASLFLISFILSQQMFNKQVNIWKMAIPRYTLTNLVDSDHFAVDREVQFIKSTGLFSSFVIVDNKKQIISQFGNPTFVNNKLLPIKDETETTWGFYYYKPNFFHFILPFLIAVGCFFILTLLVYVLIRRKIRLNLESDFFRFNTFLKEIEKVTEQLQDICIHDSELNIASQSGLNSEEIIINRAISNLLNEIKKANHSLREAVSLAEKSRFQEELTRTALQVAHDIGSPLASLEIIVQSTALTLPEQDRVSIRNAAGRIRDISSSLLMKSKPDLMQSKDEPLSQQLLPSLIHQVIGEKRLQYSQTIEINAQLQKIVFAFIKPGDFCRIISNLLNNAIEAIEVNGQIEISCSKVNNNAVIKIKDNGKGMPESLLKNFGTLGFTYGKTKGFGIGLHHALTTIEGWGGKLHIESQEGKGTSVEITLPVSPIPTWFVSNIELTKNHHIVVIDDEPFIHEIWQKKLKSFADKIHLIHFFSPKDLIKWHEEGKQYDNILYLCDYEFINSDINGIDLIKRLKINYLSILVTSRVTNDVITHCETHGIKILPKDMVDNIRISLED